MKVSEVRAFAVKIPRDFTDTIGTAGSPSPLEPAGGAPSGEREPYRWASGSPAIYSTRIETALVRVETDTGLVGWGEAQSPVAPEVTATTVEALLAPLLVDEDALAPEALWHRMYSAMRVRGHTGGFLLDAIAGVDLAVWDLCGKAFDQPVYRLLGGPVRDTVPVYVSGLAGATDAERVATARRHVAAGATALKVFMGDSERALVELVAALREGLGDGIELFVDALWRLRPEGAVRLTDELARHDVGWLEAPLMPEDVAGHAWLASRSTVPIALGESYRTRFEVRPFLDARAVGVLQPDLGRTGISEARKLATLADTYHVRVAPHVSIGLGPQIAAAMHFGAACQNLRIVECNPAVFEVANRFLKTPLDFALDRFALPRGPGLGVEPDEAALARFVA